MKIPLLVNLNLFWKGFIVSFGGQWLALVPAVSDRSWHSKISVNSESGNFSKQFWKNKHSSKYQSELILKLNICLHIDYRGQNPGQLNQPIWWNCTYLPLAKYQETQCWQNHLFSVALLSYILQGKYPWWILRIFYEYRGKYPWWISREISSMNIEENILGEYLSYLSYACTVVVPPYPLCLKHGEIGRRTSCTYCSETLRMHIAL